jgi:hypothetical protein
LDAPAIAQFLGLGNRLVSKVRMSALDRARDAIDLVAAARCNFSSTGKIGGA